MTRSDSVSRRLLGVAALFSGAALLAHLLSGVSLRIALGFTTLLLLAAIAAAVRRTRPERRRDLARFTLSAAFTGTIATIAYDASKFLLARGSTSPYNPFEAVRAFGVLLAGERAAWAIYASGIAFHLLNGIAFGIAFCFLFRRRTLLEGVGWGLFLELFQLTLYPGWLDIRSYGEFVQISVLSHLVYGIVLSITSNALIRLD